MMESIEPHYWIIANILRPLRSLYSIWWNLRRGMDLWAANSARMQCWSLEREGSGSLQVNFQTQRAKRKMESCSYDRTSIDKDVSIQYQMVLTKTLAVISILLGVYILAVYIMEQPAKLVARPNYHLGCFLSDHNTSHSLLISQKLQQLVSSSSKLSPSSSSLVPADAFNKQGVEVAHRFEQFVEDFLTYKQRMKSQVDLAKATGRAYNEYLECSNTIKAESSETEAQCTQDWQGLQKCFGQLQSIKKLFAEKLAEKEKLRAKMSELLVGRIITGEKPTDKAEQLEREFRRKDEELKKEERQLEIKVKIAGEKVTNTAYNYQVLQNNTVHCSHLYSECVDHISEYRSCEQLTQEIKSLGLGSIQSLEQKLYRKRLALIKIKQMLEEDTNQHSNRELSNHYSKGMQEYKKLHKLFVEIKARLTKHCGCSEAAEKKLKIELQNSIRMQAKAKEEMNDAEIAYKLALEELGAIRGRREKLMADLSDSLKKIPQPKEQQDLDIDKHMKPLEDKDKQIEKWLMGYKTQFDSIEFKCNQIKARLSLKLPTFDAVSRCIGKKAYYEELKSRLSQSNRGNRPMDERSKRKLRESLLSFKL